MPQSAWKTQKTTSPAVCDDAPNSGHAIADGEIPTCGASPIQKEVDDVAMNDPVFGKRDLVAGNHQLGIVVANSGEVAELTLPVAVGNFIGHLDVELFVLLPRGDEVDLFSVDAAGADRVAAGDEFIYTMVS